MIERTRDLLQDANAGRELERAYGLEHALERAAIHPFGGVPQKMVGAAEAGRRDDVRVLELHGRLGRPREPIRPRSQLLARDGLERHGAIAVPGEIHDRLRRASQQRLDAKLGRQLAPCVELGRREVGLLGHRRGGRRAPRVRRRGSTARGGAAAAPGAGGGRGLSARGGRRRVGRVAAPHAGPRALGQVRDNTPGAVLVGCTANASLVAGPGAGGGVAVMSNASLVSAASGDAVAVSVYPLPIWSMRKLAKVAIPFTAATSAVPVSCPSPSTPPLSPMATFTLPVKLVTTFPAESNAVTCSGGRMMLSFIVLSG